MPQLLADFRTLADLTVHELAGLRILNDELWKSERWIREHAARTLFAALTAATTRADTAKFPTRYSQQQPALTARILCIGQASHGDRDEQNDFVVASLSGAAILETDGRRGYERRATEGEETLLGMNPCSLFKLLFNQVNGDWLRMLDVQTLRLEMAVTATRSLDVQRTPRNRLAHIELTS
ncbi:hypothetical protein [Paraburkholderia tropica]|uniref:hypothetical protein n=1 Tax=Paraburkholderia tropica TaxID=92647 RepID=UPI003D2B0303